MASAAASADPRIQNLVACHAWNRDRTKVAVCPGNHQVLIYAVKGKDWTLEATLEEHDSFISGIDWSPVTDFIVTCSHDRNAYVWKCNASTKKWEPTLVILRINRAATAVKWSPDGKKFAVASGAKSVPVCHYEASNDWWISKMIKSHKSTVLNLDWCPNSKLLVTGSSDKRCRIFSAYIPEIDSDDDAAIFADIFPSQHEFGEVLAEFDQGSSWINSVAWSPSMFRIAFAGHNSTLSFVQILSGSAPLVQTIKHEGLPYTTIAFLNDNTLVAAGWDMNPTLYSASGSAANPSWAFLDRVDKAKKAEANAPKANSGFGAARAMFAGAASHGIAIKDNAAVSSNDSSSVNTRHQNTITGIWLWRDDATAPTAKFTTCGADGRVIFWDLSTTDINLASLKL